MEGGIKAVGTIFSSPHSVLCDASFHDLRTHLTSGSEDELIQASGCESEEDPLEEG